MKFNDGIFLRRVNHVGDDSAFFMTAWNTSQSAFRKVILTLLPHSDDPDW